MADLPPERLRLLCPPFYSTGVDCFGPYLVRELQVGFEALEPQAKPQLAEHQILFKFNPLEAPHFSGVWDREVQLLKNALQVAVGSQVVSKYILYTV